MLFGAEPFLARLSVCWQAAITGEPRTGKDLLAREIARYYLDRGYKFYSNSLDVWNDSLHREMTFRQYCAENGGFKGKTNLDDHPLADVVDDFPDVKRRVFVLTEAGDYLREWKYFKNLNMFKGKFRDIWLYPSMRLPHVDLSELYCFPHMLREFIPGVGLASIWEWVYESGRGARVGGSFFFVPEIIGTYETEDTSISPKIALDWFNKQIDWEQRRFGRNGLSDMETPQEEGIDGDTLAAIQRI